MAFRCDIKHIKNGEDVTIWEAELFNIARMLKTSLENLEKSGMTYIPKNTNNGDNFMPNNSSKTSVELKSELKQELKPELEALKNSLDNCQKCKLCAARTNIVFGVGSHRAKLVFVGEGPGAEEDKQGEPFVGRAGQLLTKMIIAMGLSRDQVYICNVVKCRPPENRDPEPDEIAACEPFLKSQLEIIKPQIIVGLGRYACQTLLKTTAPMSSFRGTWHEYLGVKFMPTFHPAYLLRNPPAKKFVWEDLQKVMAELK